MKCPWRETVQSTAVGAITVERRVEWEPCIKKECPFWNDWGEVCLRRLAPEERRQATQ